MALPININDLVHGQTVEWERLEFKQGWNPEEIVHTICAFANDINNWGGGGYIIVGIAENAGQPVLPPAGLQQNQLDHIQGEIVRLAHQLQPNYFPISQPYVIDGQHILVLWCPAGDNRPYTAPSTQGGKAQRHRYVRSGSRSIVARGVLDVQLTELAARIPFDDRINNQASIDDLDLATIQAYLQEVKSDLYAESTSMSLTEVARAMRIAKGPDEAIRPVNVGLLFFSKTPEAFFPRTQIEIVVHKDDTGKSFKEHIFNGPLHVQLRDALSFIKNNILSEQIVKHKDKAEADRFENYPYTAIEEALSNAVYHKSYEIGSPIEVQIWQDKIEILSYPAPVPPVTNKILETKKRIVARDYRNRRIGDFLKELRLTEGRGTGFPSIYNAMEENGSPAPTFETDDESYVLVTLPARVNDQARDQEQTATTNEATNQVKAPVFNTIEDIIAFSNQVSNQAKGEATVQVNDQASVGASVGAQASDSRDSIDLRNLTDGARDGARDGALKILNDQVHTEVVAILTAVKQWTKRTELFDSIGLTNRTGNRKKYLDPLFEFGWIQIEFPDNMTHPNQRYKITAAGKRILDLITA
ncbi:ATP-dependent DNA helicase [Nonlabens ulvanivorans]|uniref:ATP-dependent DNA helicase n=1 Tax=Nonlabens ulvanivorans TaxID=906888 RepID=A0A081D9P2_NONUL|nr:RNA-binding domain-containing protein [Nonlabens ulvanivorans]GAK75638.1 ATP-dependent DNA helicase [Nonlabens ulvanivorans]